MAPLLVVLGTPGCAHRGPRQEAPGGRLADRVDVTTFGATADAHLVMGCSMAAGSRALDCTGGFFETADIGKEISVRPADGVGPIFSSHVEQLLSGKSVSLRDCATAPLSPADALVGTDDASAFESAIAESGRLGKPLWIPRGVGGYRLGRTIVVSVPVSILSDGAALVPDIPATASNSALFSVQSSNVTFGGLRFDGAAAARSSSLAGNRYCIQALGSPSKRLADLTVRGCTFTDLAQRGQPVPHGHWMNVWHGVYLAYVDRPTIEHCGATHSALDMSLSGAFLVLDSTAGALVTDNAPVHDTGWYSIHLDSDNHGFDIRGNVVSGNNPGDRDWGGSIDVMGQLGTAGGQSKPSDSDGRIHGNTISGVHNYSQALRVAGSSNVEVDHNQFMDVTGGHDPDNNVVVVGLRSVDLSSPSGDVQEGSARVSRVADVRSWIVGSGGTAIAGDGIPPDAKVVGVDYDQASLTLSTAATATRKGVHLVGCAFGVPPKHVRIHHNTFIAHGAAQRALYAQGAVAKLGIVPPPADDLQFDDNVMRSLDASNYLSGVYVHGLDSGWTNVEIARNDLTAQGGANQPAAGSIAVTAYAGAQMRGVRIVNNHLSFFDASGPPSGTNQIGIFVSRSEDVSVAGNAGSGFFYGILVDPSCGRDVRDLRANAWSRSASASDVIDGRLPPGAP